jgi:hypothetical protein
MTLPLFSDASGNKAKANVNHLTEEISEKLVNAICHSGLGNCLVVGD